MDTLTSIKELAPTVAVSMISAYVLIRIMQNVEKMQRATEETNRATTDKYLEALDNKDKMMERVIHEHNESMAQQTDKISRVLEELSSIVKILAAKVELLMKHTPKHNEEKRNRL